MDINKLIIMLLVVSACTVGYLTLSNENVAYANETYITPTSVSVYMTNLYATITVKIKNNNNHVEYFKISQQYTDHLTTPVSSVIEWTDPTAIKMIDAVSPDLGGDYGWKIQPGETKTVTFNLLAVNPNSTSDPLDFVILNQASVPDTYWPLIPDPGLYSSWFQPNEIEFLNPNFDLEDWKGHFSVLVVSRDSHTVNGVVRAPVVPTDSKLTYSNPKATFSDKDIVMGTNIAAWDISMPAGGSEELSYTYEWPAGSSGSSTGKASYSAAKNSSTSNPPVSTKETGVPYGLFVVGAVMAAGGLIYSRFVR